MKMVNMGELFAFGRLNGQEMERVPVTESESASFGLRPGDLLFARQSLIAAGAGKCSIVLAAPEPTTFESHLIRVQLDASKADPHYFYYYLMSPDGRGRVQSLVMQVAAAGIRGSELAKLPVPVPPTDVQRRIAAVLSAYDDLTENNTRRIAVLEGMVRSLYREWFVDFRFPGHQQGEMVDSALGAIPHGWQVTPMSTVADVIDCLHSKKPEAVEGGSGILLQLFNIADGGKLDLSQTYRVSDEDYIQWTSRIEAQEGDCVITNVGRIAAVAQVPPGVKAALGRNMTAVRPKPGVLAPTFLIEYLLSSHMENEVHQKKDAGAIMDSLNVRAIVKLLVPMPSPELMQAFENLARPMRRRVELLVQQNHNLRTTRNLLLPRLMSGELDVSGLDIHTEGLSA